MVSRFLVSTRHVVRRCLVVMVSRVGVMFGGFAMMVRGFFGHVYSFGQEPSLGSRTVGTVLNGWS